MKISLVSMPVQDPVKAHKIYTEKLGFISKEYVPDANLAIVVSPENPTGTAILLEPCKGTFAEEYQASAFDACLPIMGLAIKDAKAEYQRLASVGVRLRPELNKPDFGIMNVFEDGCGNLLMLEEL